MKTPAIRSGVELLGSHLPATSNTRTSAMIREVYILILIHICSAQMMSEGELLLDVIGRHIPGKLQQSGNLPQLDDNL